MAVINYTAIYDVITDVTRDLALASMARDDPPASSTASSTAARRAGCSTAAAMCGKVGSEFET